MAQGDHKRFLISARRGRHHGCPPLHERIHLETFPPSDDLQPGSRFTIPIVKTVAVARQRCSPSKRMKSCSVFVVHSKTKRVARCLAHDGRLARPMRSQSPLVSISAMRIHCEITHRVLNLPCARFVLSRVVTHAISPDPSRRCASSES